MDNFFKSCPPKMEDGRHMTDYRTATRREEYNKYLNKIVRNDDYRLFLQQNGSKYMDEDFNYFKKNYSCWVNECIHTYPTRMLPAWFVEERIKYDSLLDPSKKIVYKCSEKKDYRLTEN